MKSRHALIALFALIAIPLALSLGTVLLIPVALLLIPAVLVAAVAAVPALFVWLARAEAPDADGPSALAIPTTAPTAT